MVLVDAHVHLSNERFDEDIEEVIQRAFESGLRAFVNVSTNQEELEKSFLYNTKFSHLKFYHVAGCPPQDALNYSQNDFNFIEKMAQEGRLSAIGEVGLDYNNSTSEEDKIQQKKVLILYLDLALKYHLPIVVHCRNAFHDFFQIIDEHYIGAAFSKPGMLHCFTGTLEEARSLIARNWWISISGIATFKNAVDLQEVVKNIPIDNLLIETDAPYLAPVPFRGQRNEPGFIKYTFDFIAVLKGLSVDDLISRVDVNVKKFLN